MSQSEGDVKTPDSSDSSITDGKPLTRLSLNSIPSIDRSEDESPTSGSNPPPNLAHTPPPEEPIFMQPNLAHTPPPPEDIRSSQPVPNLAHTPPPPPCPQTAAEAMAEASRHSSPRIMDDSPGDAYATIPGSSDPSTPDPRRPPYPIGYKRSSLDAGSEPMGYGVLGSSPPSLNGVYGAIGGLYSSSHPSSGIYSGSASLGSIYGNSGPPPPVPPPPLDTAGIMESHHRREHSFNSLHSVNSLREFYDKSLNHFISTSPKLSNRDIEMNKMSSIYGGSIGGEYTGLTEMLTDPVEEEVSNNSIIKPLTALN